MARLESLQADHAEALLRFEQENRAYFAAVIPDRGDDYFADFDAILRERLAEQTAGVCAFHVLVDDDGQILGRINLVDLENGAAELGYRVAQRATGRGLATAGVREVCVRAAGEYGLSSVSARVTLANAASRVVLARTGFVPTEEIELNGRPALRLTRDLTVDAPAPA